MEESLLDDDANEQLQEQELESSKILESEEAPVE
jgi:hypothetical protein